MFRSTTQRVAGNLTVSDADILLLRETSFECFGTSMLVTPSVWPNSTSLLIVGAPAYFNSNGSVGRVYVFAINGNEATNVSMITGMTDKAKFGWRLAGTLCWVLGLQRTC